MEDSETLTKIALAALFHIIANLVFTKMIFSREPSTSKSLFLVAVLWLIPILGILFVYKNLGLNWFGRKGTSSGISGASTSFLEMDAIFNPGSKAVIEEMQREKTEVRQEGEMYEEPEAKVPTSPSTKA